MAAALQHPIASLSQPLAEPDWQQQLTQLNQQPIGATERLDWMLVMREKLFGNEQGTVLASANLDDEAQLNLMIALAQKLCDWPLVIYLREQADNRFGCSFFATDNRAALAEAYHQQGQLSEAAQCIRRCLLVDCQQPQLAQYYGQLRQAAANSLFAPQDMQAGAIMLTPMTRYHLESFCWAYADPQISEQCNLPAFDSDEHWLNWLATSEQGDGKHLFAVTHREWGLIGSVSLEVLNGVGFFYYWLGADFQGYGFGPQAVELLLDLGAIYLGMSCCYAKVYAHNTPSHKGMSKLGFRQLPFSVEPPYDNEVLYYLGADKSEQTLFEELEQLFNDQQCSLQLTGALARHLGLGDDH
jgi:RimJ/RimL family protein N-acetyltransferase